MSVSAFFIKIVKKSFLSSKKSLVVVLLSLISLSISQSLFFLIIRPFLAVFFESHNTSEVVFVSDFLNSQFIDYLPNYVTSFSLKKTQMPHYVLGILLFSIFAKNIASYFYNISIASIGGLFVKMYRDSLFESLIYQSYESLSQKSSSQWMSMVMNDVSYLQNRFYDIMNSFFKDVTLVISAFFIMSMMNYKLTIIMIFVFPVFSYLIGLNSKLIATLVQRMQLELANMAASFTHIRKRIDEIWLSSSQDHELSLFEKHSRKYFLLSCKMSIRRCFVAPIAEFIGYGIFISIFFLKTSYGFFHTGDSIVFFASLAVAIKPLKGIGEQITRIFETKGSLDSLRLIESCQLKKNVFIATSNKRIDEIVIKNACFKWNSSPDIFMKDFVLKKGKVVVIRGGSGSGKTTLIKGLSGLISPRQWESSLSWEKFSQDTVLVPQFPYVFNDSILDNIYYGSKKDLNSDQILNDYLHKLGLYEAVQKLPDAIHTKTGFFDEVFSGGQIQRLVLMRALMQNKSVLLLDEFTSSLDEKIEYDICSHLVQIVRKNRLSLVVTSHRPRIMELADRVYEVKNWTLLEKKNNEHARSLDVQ